MDVSLYVQKALSQELASKNSEFITAFTDLLRQKLSKRIHSKSERHSHAEHFWVMGNQTFDTWFVGCIGLIRVVEGFVAGIVCGYFHNGKASDFQKMDKLSQEEYTKHFPLEYETIERHVYVMTSVEAGQQPHIEFEYPDSDESI